MENNPKILILIVNWNNFPDTKVCLNSLSLLAYENYQVVVVDNGSSDGSSELIIEQYPEITLIELDQNLGFAGGNNVGLVFAQEKEFPYVLLLNNDTSIDQKDFLSKLIVEYDGDPKICAIGPMVKQTDGLTQLTILPYPTVCNTFWNTLGAYQPDQNKKQFIDSVSGCCVLVRMEAIIQAGFLDENFFMYGEETEWFYRMRKKDWKVLYMPIESIFHKGASSTKKLESQSVYLERRANLIYMLVKHGHKLQAFVITLLMISLLSCRILFSALTRKQNHRDSYSFSMINELRKAIQIKWNIALETRNRKS